ncbi:MAG: TIGR03000 domain-containing protein, partial [Pirellulales bacterium]|nr:TIGR03000 domain-containing protein [Pirellulales bacterium]
SYGSHASYGSYGSHASYGSYGSHASYGSYGAVSYGTVSRTPVYSASTKNVQTDAELLAAGSAAIEVSLPTGAKVYVNDKETSSSGSTRNYISKGLSAGQTYAYRFRVEFERDGEPVVENKSVRLQAGHKVALNFGATSDQPKLASAEGMVQTKLKVSVPENALVFLAGMPTRQTGAKRSYATRRLKAGERWEGYTIRVELEQEGQQLVQQRTLEIEGGQSYELAFDFDSENALQFALLEK